jgi:hypothetical protein
MTSVPLRDHAEKEMLSPAGAAQWQEHTLPDGSLGISLSVNDVPPHARDAMVEVLRDKFDIAAQMINIPTTPPTTIIAVENTAAAPNSDRLKTLLKIANGASWQDSVTPVTGAQPEPAKTIGGMSDADVAYCVALLGRLGIPATREMSATGHVIRVSGVANIAGLVQQLPTLGFASEQVPGAQPDQQVNPDPNPDVITLGGNPDAVRRQGRGPSDQEPDGATAHGGLHNALFHADHIRTLLALGQMVDAAGQPMFKMQSVGPSPHDGYTYHTPDGQHHLFTVKPYAVTLSKHAMDNHDVAIKASLKAAAHLFDGDIRIIDAGSELYKIQLLAVAAQMIANNELPADTMIDGRQVVPAARAAQTRDQALRAEAPAPGNNGPRPIAKFTC